MFMQRMFKLWTHKKGKSQNEFRISKSHIFPRPLWVAILKQLMFKTAFCRLLELQSFRHLTMFFVKVAVETY